MHYQDLSALIYDTPLAALEHCIPKSLRQSFNHGDLARWQRVISQLPELVPSSLNLKTAVTVGRKQDCSLDQRQNTIDLLMQLRPWRKGPFKLYGIDLNTEWRSDWKWQRLIDHISPLQGRQVLDVGCGNGYHCWRMAGEGASLVVGIDPALLFVMQYWAIRHFIPQPPVYVIPATLEKLPEKLEAFDTAFSMGVLYHRRSPIDHLLELKASIRSGGELVLETLVIDGPVGQTLTPSGTYAKMPNVWLVPSCLTTENWLQRCGFKNIRLIDVSTTTIEEQHSSSWMPFQSLKDALDPRDLSITVEGLPAPKRAIFVANVP